MFATGGKNIATVLRENGFHVLADIFEGISIGADIVSIAFPVGAALKSMSKIGVKAFAKASITAMKTSAKETFRKVFKSGLKDGVKNFFKVAFKTFVFDVDDFKVIKEPSIGTLPNKKWTVTDDGSSLVPTNGTAKPKRYNPEGLTYDEILDKFHLDSIPLKKNGQVDWGKIELDSVNIKHMTDERGNNKYTMDLKSNYGKANAKLQQKGLSIRNLEINRGIGITWHEDINLTSMRMVPSEIHGNINHKGGVANYGFILGRVGAQSNNVIENIMKKIQRSIITNTRQPAY